MSAAGRDDGSSFWEWVVLWGLGIVALASGGLWLVGGLASLASGSGWPESSAGAMPGVLSRLPEHLADPGAAWPAGDPAHGMWPVAFYGVALLAAAAVLGGVLAVSEARERWRGRASGDERDARWASGRDLAPLVVPEPTVGRVNLGRQGRRLLAAEPRQSVIVFGPTQTGKTTSLAVPAILEWQGPVVCTSVKTDLLRDTIVARSAIPDGDVLVFDPTASTGLPRNTWTPIAGCADWSHALRTAWWMTMAAKGEGGTLEDADYWYSSAAKLLAPLLFAAAHVGADMGEMIQWVDSGDDQDTLATLDSIGHGPARRAFQAHVNREERTRSSITTTLETALLAYSDPVVLESAVGCDIRAAGLVDGGWHTTYLCAPSHEQHRLKPLFATIVQQIIAAAFERSAMLGRPLDPPLLLVLDECANIAPIAELATVASTGAGQGVQLVTVFQDMAQIDAVYGRDRAPTIVSNHRAKLVLPGIADGSTLQYVERLLGDEAIDQHAMTRGYTGDRSTTESTAYRSLTPGNRLREMEVGEALLVYGRLPPARIRLRPWFAEPALAGRERSRPGGGGY